MNHSFVISSRDDMERGAAVGGTATDSGSRIIPWEFETGIDPVVTTQDQWIWCDGRDQFIPAGSSIRIFDSWQVENPVRSEWSHTRFRWVITHPQVPIEADRHEWPDAVFVVAPAPPPDHDFFATGVYFAATTRPDSDEIGFPGGKVEGEEHPVTAACREAAEEGWRVYGIHPVPIHRQQVDGKQVWWYRARNATRIPAGMHKESGRVEPVTRRLSEIQKSGFGNDNIDID